MCDLPIGSELDGREERSKRPHENCCASTLCANGRKCDEDEFCRGLSTVELQVAPKHANDLQSETEVASSTQVYCGRDFTQPLPKQQQQL